MSVRVAVREALQLLTMRDRRLLLVAIVIQMATSLLDLVGVLLLGLVGALAVTTVQSQPAPTIVTSVADAVGLGEFSDQALVGVFAGAAAVVLLVKSAVSSLLTRRVFIFLANRQALVSARLAGALMSRPLVFLQQRSSQETAYALIQGAGAATLNILGQLVIVATEVALLAVLGLALLIIDPWVTLGAIAFFALIGLVLQRIMGGWATRLGRTGAEADIASLNTIQDALASYREITVLDRRRLYVSRFQDLRWTSASVSADRTFILQVPKYVFEAALVVGGVLLAGSLFLTKDSVAAVGTLALFLAAATRVMPSLLRLQGAALTLRDNAAAAVPTFTLAEELGHPQEDPSDVAVLDEAGIGTLGVRGEPIGVDVQGVTIRYPGSSAEALHAVSLVIPPGGSAAIVGRSGAGKSTLADAILGVLEPESGRILLDGLDPRDLVAARPGAIGYVPQSVSLVNGTVRENVALGLPGGAVPDELVWRALERAHVADVFQALETGLDTPIGEGGMKVSGGQRQRLGIARAFLVDPVLLVMDEATSALDAETEEAITELIRDLHGEVTTLVIAHRLSTVKLADTVVYIDDGQIVDQGAFSELRDRVPALARQASLMGL